MNNTKFEAEVEKRLEKRVVAELSPVDTEELYCDYLDEINPTIVIQGGTGSTGGLSYCASNLLKRVDPTAFNCGEADYADSLVGETISEEIGGDHYDLAKVEEIREDIEAELEAEIGEKEEAGK
ncbi:MAG: hypothetical protein EBY29_10240 [Planctomycetes bacterium]|nr:hypothetical protein [Planctomycetota bacterium]